MNPLSDISSKPQSSHVRVPPGRTLSGEYNMNSSYTLERFRLDRSSRSDANHSLRLSDARLDMSASDRNSSRASLDMSGSSTRSSRRRSERQLFLAHRCTLPENTPNWLSGSASSTGDDGFQRRQPVTPLFPVTERSADESNGPKEDTPQFLVFRRRRPSLRRVSSWS